MYIKVKEKIQILKWYIKNKLSFDSKCELYFKMGRCNVKIPTEIKSAIRKSGKYNKLATENNNIVRNWLEQNIPDSVFWENYLIDSIEQGCDRSEALIEFLENDCNEIKD